MLENVNPLTGQANTPIFAMAYNALLNVVLIAIWKEMGTRLEVGNSGFSVSGQ